MQLNNVNRKSKRAKEYINGLRESGELDRRIESLKEVDGDVE